MPKNKVKTGALFPRICNWIANGAMYPQSIPKQTEEPTKKPKAKIKKV